MQKTTAYLKKFIRLPAIKITLFLLFSLTLISWDRATKDYAKENLKDKQAISFLHDGFRLEYIENTGAAMSFADELSRPASFWLLAVLPLLFLSALFIYLLKNSRTLSVTKLFTFALIFSGGIGNVGDRLLFDRHVTDFMNVGILNFRSGIFNFADLWITTGVLYFIFLHRRTPAT